MNIVRKSSIRIRSIIYAFAGLMIFSGLTAHALPATYYASNSKLNEGKWVKIKTSGEGIHEISYDKLLSWGFSNPEKVHVYGYGATLLASDDFKDTHPDDIVPTYTNHENGKIYFYSTGSVTASLLSLTTVKAERNYYSNDVYYLLSDRELDETEIPQTVPYTPNQDTRSIHLSVLYQKEETQNPTELGAYFLGNNIPAGGAADIVFTIEDMDFGYDKWQNATMRFGFAAYNRTSTSIDVKLPSELSSLDYSINKSSAQYTSDEYFKYKPGYSTLTIKSVIPDGTYTFKGAAPTNMPEFLAADYSWLIYPRLNRLGEHNQITMFFPDVTATRNFSIIGPENTRVVNISSIGNAYAHEVVYDAEEGVLTGSFDRAYSSPSSACRLVAYNVDQPQFEVKFVEDVANQNLHSLDTPDMVIITISELMESAQELAQIHQNYDGMEVLVVDHTKLFNEFSSATPDAMGYRRFIKMLYDRNPEKLKYVIMYGPSHWDNRSVLTTRKSRLLTYETTNPEYSGKETWAFGTDSYFGMLSDTYDPNSINKALLTIPVGRIPISDNVHGFSFNRKIVKYLENLPSVAVYNNILMMSDDGDSNTHMNQSEELGKTLETLHKPLTLIRAYNSIYPWDGKDAKELRSLTTQALKRGVGLFTYVGHGIESYFGQEYLWSISSTKTTSYNVHPLGLFATCSVYCYDTSKTSIGEEMLLKEDGGLVALVAAGRVVYGTMNQYLAQRMVEGYAKATGGTTFGQLWLEARNNVISRETKEIQLNTLCYNFAGDPALPVSAPTYDVAVTAVNDTPIANGDEVKIAPLQQIKIEGAVVNADQSVVNDFNGTITLHLYDAPYSVTSFVRVDSDSAQEIMLDERILTVKRAQIVNGKFSTTFVAPAPVFEGGINRLTLHADADNGLKGDGIIKNLVMETQSENKTDFVGNLPSIDKFSMSQIIEDDISFVPTVVKLVANGDCGDTGINTSTAIGSSSMLIVDGNSRVEGFSESLMFNGDDTWSMSIDLSDLSYGPHTATLVISDNAGNRVSKSLDFICGDHQSLRLLSDVSTVRDEVTFDLENEPGDIASSRLIITDRKGNTIVNRQNIQFPYTLNTNDSQLDYTPGHYNAYVQITTANGRGASAKLPLVFIK